MSSPLPLRSASESPQGFAARLAEALRPLDSAEAIKASASELLCAELRADRVAYFEVAGQDYVVERDHTLTLPSLAGRYPLTSFGTSLLETLRGGRTASEEDVRRNSALTDGELAAFDVIQVRAFVAVPFVKGGELVAGLTVHQAEPRVWDEVEVVLIQETAERTWSAVETARALRQFRASERLRRMALDAARLGVWSVDPLDMTLTTDERFRTIFHGSTDPSPYERAFGAIHPEDQERIAAAVAAAMNPEEPAPYAQEYRVIRPDGSMRWVFATGRANVVDGPQGPHTESFDGTLEDITERVKTRNELELLLHELKEQDRRKDEFLAMLSHELRNPLAPILNAAQLLRLRGNADPLHLQASAVIERQVGQLKRLVDDLLEVSRITTGRVQLHQERVAVQGFLHSAVETSRPLIERHRHALSVSLPEAPIWVNADAARMEQVFVNLLTNAAKYSDEGGRIRVTAVQEGGGVVMRVADTGAGIAPDLLPRVFDLFTQAERSLARSDGGLGIGLALVKRLVELHGGLVDVTSTLGQGSEFVVRLPVDAIGEFAGSPDIAVPARSSGSRVLIVDDNIDAAGSLAELLREMGHHVGTAHDGPSALAAADAGRPEVVLLDIGLPLMDGYEVARRMREHPIHRGVTLVALTGYAHASDLARSGTAGFDHHLVKPADFEQIAEILASDKSRREQDIALDT